MTDTQELEQLLASCTPGPWTLDDKTVYALDETGNCNRFSVRAEGGWTWRSSGSLGASGDRTPEVELVADVRLISLAPTLASEVIALRNALAMSVAEMESVRPLLVDAGHHRKAAALGSQCDFNRRHIDGAALTGDRS